MEVSHSHNLTLQLAIFQYYTYGSIEVEVEEGCSQHTALTDTTSDSKLIRCIPIGPDSSTRVLIHGMTFGGEIVQALKHGPKSFTGSQNHKSFFKVYETTCKLDSKTPMLSPS